MGSDVGQIFPTASLHRDHLTCMRWYVRKNYLTWVKTAEISIWCARNWFLILAVFLTLIIRVVLPVLSGGPKSLYILVSKLKVPTLYWLPKRHKTPYKARFIANSSSCTTTELSKSLTSCLTAVKNMLSSIVKRYMRDSVKTDFGLLKIQVKF